MTKNPLKSINAAGVFTRLVSASIPQRSVYPASTWRPTHNVPQLGPVMPYILEYIRFGSVVIRGVAGILDIRVTRVSISADSDGLSVSCEINGNLFRHKWAWSELGFNPLASEWVSVPHNEAWQIRVPEIATPRTETHGDEASVTLLYPIQMRYRAPWWMRPFQPLMTVSLDGFNIRPDSAVPRLSGLLAGWVAPVITWRPDQPARGLVGFRDQSRSRQKVEAALNEYNAKCEASGVQPTQDGAAEYLRRTGVLGPIGYVLLVTFLSEWIRDWFIRRRGT